GKLAGILLESQGDGRGGLSHLIVGIGVNLATAPEAATLEPGALRPVSLRAETGIAIAPEPFLGLLAPAFDRFDRQISAYGFAPIRAAFLQGAARLGQPITARLPAETLTGTFRDIDETGNLVLETRAARRTIAAAEIFF
ncbi:MAG: biotin--[acetyl-CoA-carboxylase] ligase, partial [Roseicyclus sp.]